MARGKLISRRVPKKAKVGDALGKKGFRPVFVKRKLTAGSNDLLRPKMSNLPYNHHRPR